MLISGNVPSEGTRTLQSVGLHPTTQTWRHRSEWRLCGRNVRSESLLLMAVILRRSSYDSEQALKCLHYHMSAVALLCRSCNNVITYETGLTVTAAIGAHNGRELDHGYKTQCRKQLCDDDSQPCAVEECNPVRRGEATQ